MNTMYIYKSIYIFPISINTFNILKTKALISENNIIQMTTIPL
jgi:hypothetical protein